MQFLHVRPRKKTMEGFYADQTGYGKCRYVPAPNQRFPRLNRAGKVPVVVFRLKRAIEGGRVRKQATSVQKPTVKGDCVSERLEGRTR